MSAASTCQLPPWPARRLLAQAGGLWCVRAMPDLWKLAWQSGFEQPHAACPSATPLLAHYPPTQHPTCRPAWPFAWPLPSAPDRPLACALHISPNASPSATAAFWRSASPPTRPIASLWSACQLPTCSYECMSEIKTLSQRDPIRCFSYCKRQC